MLGVSKSSGCICLLFHQIHALYHCLRIPHTSPGPPTTASLIHRCHSQSCPWKHLEPEYLNQFKPYHNHHVEEEATLLATATASLTETLVKQRREIRNDASPSPTPFHQTSAGPREAAWLPRTRSRSNHLSFSVILGILQSLPISGPIWSQFLFSGCAPSHSSW